MIDYTLIKTMDLKTGADIWTVHCISRKYYYGGARGSGEHSYISTDPIDQGHPTAEEAIKSKADHMLMLKRQAVREEYPI